MSKANQIRQKAQEFLSKGHIDKAIQEYRRLLTLESKNPNLYNELGDILLRTGDKAQAVQNFEKAAVIYEKVALYNNAVAVCKKILRVDPEKIDTMFRLAELRAKQKLTGEAVSYFTQYIESVLENPQALLPKAQKDVDLILELMPANGTVLERSIEIFEQLGIKLRTAVLCRRLAVIAAQEGDSKKQAKYTRKIEEIKAALSPAELEGLREQEEAAGGEMPAAVPAEAGDAQPAPSNAPDAADDSDGRAAAAGAEALPQPSEAEAGSAASAVEAGSPAGAGYDSVVDEAVEEAEMVAAMSQGRAPFTPGGAFVERRKPAAENPPEIANEDPPASTAPASPNPPVADVAPVSDIRPAGSTRIEGLAEEITSDVEKDDLRSHYDLGMAYLEMGLFTEAIREFQSASRAEEFQVSSMEMIGYCFLKCNQPRLAVKQLTHALQIEKATGAGSLGIHFNLGLAYEMLGELDAAREHFEEVYIMDMSFRDVADKMKKLSAVS